MGLPAEVIEALAHYRRLLDERGWDWGDEQLPDFFRWARFSMLGPLFEAVADTGDWAKAIRSVVGEDVPPGVVEVRVDEGSSLRAYVGPARPAIAGRTVPIDVVVDSASRADLRLTVAGRDLDVAPRGAAIETIDLDGTDSGFTVGLGDETLRVEGAIHPSAEAELRLSSPRCSRWSVTDSSGGAWFPEGALAKWDVHHRPFFHGHDVTVAVPAESLHVVCARGLEFGRTEFDVLPSAGETRIVECDPPRLFDPTAEGWYGGDVHVHMNYSGDLVCAPSEAARMQLGEGLHLVNLVAANFSTSLVYDRDMLKQFAGADLPWSTDDAVARVGVEYRNDLLGHVHALGPSGPPTRYYAGHEQSDHPEDWPPNKVACEEMRVLGATVGYPHPAFTAFPADWSIARFFQTPRSVEARELVADAALGVVDSVDLISPFDDEGAVFLYHPLLSCGLRLAATAGTDAFLSFSHGPGVASNPPGWGRVYAHLGDRGLSVEAFKEAIREGRTVVTNGPWLAFEVNGRGPGAVLDMVAGTASTSAPAFKARRPSTSRSSDPMGSWQTATRHPNSASRRRWRTGRLGSRPWPAAPATPTRSTSRCWPTPRRCTSTSPAVAWPERPTRDGAWSSSTLSSAWPASTAASIRRPARPTSATSSRSSTRLAPSTAEWSKPPRGSGIRQTGVRRVIWGALPHRA
ncbi:MAG: CehA/McbA family metallohydrolase [Actinomycetota bacterium]|nr:CehA/McbA family metallohydrolase [Actinomycetota bacterium]